VENLQQEGNGELRGEEEMNGGGVAARRQGRGPLCRRGLAAVSKSGRTYHLLKWRWVCNNRSTVFWRGGWPPAALGLGGRCQIGVPRSGWPNRAVGSYHPLKRRHEIEAICANVKSDYLAVGSYHPLKRRHEIEAICANVKSDYLFS
jgi:hypothetical protein